MIRLLLLVLVVFLGVLIGPSLVGTDSYVLVAINGWTLETSLVVMAMMITVFYGILQFAEWALINTLAMWGRTRHWFGWRKERIAEQKTLDGVLEYAAGHFAHAEKLSVTHIEHSKTPLLNYFTAINAAAIQGKTQQRDEYLDQALLSDASNIALLATKLRFMVEDNAFEDAKNWLITQPDVIAYHVDILPLNLVINKSLNAWDEVIKLNNLLLKHKLQTPIEHESLLRRCYIGLLHMASQESFEKAQQYHKAIPRKNRNHVDIFSEYAKLSIKYKQSALIEKELFQRLSKQLDNVLLTVLNELDAKCAKVWCERLVNLNKYHQDVDFLDAVIHLYIVDRQWKLAKDWLFKAITITPNSVRFETLAKIQQELGEGSGALESFNKALLYRQV
jgi:HemY protein